MASQDVSLQTQLLFEGTSESTKAHNAWFMPTAIWLWDREGRQKQAGFLLGQSLYLTWCFLQPEGHSLPFIHAWEQRRGKLWALPQRQKQLPGSIVPQTASRICFRRQWGKTSLAALWVVLQLTSFLRSIHLLCEMQFLLIARCPTSEDLVLYFCPSLAEQCTVPYFLSQVNSRFYPRAVHR